MEAPALCLALDPTRADDSVAAALAGILADYRVASIRLDPPAGSPAGTLGPAVARLRALTEAAEVPLVLRGDADAAARLGLDGVETDGSARAVAAARRTLGPRAIVGGRAGLSRHRGITAAEAGADYVVLGPVGPGSDGPWRDLLDWWAEMITTPCIAEGPIDPACADSLAGVADFLCLGAPLWAEPAGAAAALARFGRWRRAPECGS